MTTHLVVGAGLIGRPLAERLVARGDTVTVATRSGSAVVGAAARVLDASDPAAFTRAAADAATIFLCTNPPYTDWAASWPPVIEAAIDAASASGSRIVVMGNLYPYGSPTGAMSEHSPETTTEAKGLIRRDGWARMRAAHDAGRIQAVEVRASDYFGPGATGTAHLGEGFFRAILRSSTAHVVGKPHTLHSWSYLPDIVTTLIAAADYRGPQHAGAEQTGAEHAGAAGAEQKGADHRGGWGRIWHVPSATISRTDIAGHLNAHYGTRGKVSGYPQWLLRSLGVVHPLTHEVWASSYQFVVPFEIDSTETQRELGVAATPWNEALLATAESYR
ncbi:NAD-dependent epimerase/dehydratase family protein [Cryobacterium melibiosiphilum]|uniref:NAD-dependent epimerase/dehydratase family protein n=1 Tax=Cryobacterium melibiosiphilum TaxID=995039 RepID=A0A3A5MF19_9MICO|nr:NAD-dependent epimerase/dehydratase family protein [Cryobacterium melibiosiphilum]RJT85693.1 NAD-dependent epimerase/dehydratase family protein [Cryobacterium melibiosiphilum]